MHNLSSYCGLTYSRTSASEKDLPVSRVNLNVNISVKRLVHDGVKVIFNVRKQRERHSFSEAGARYKKNHDFLRSSWWFSAFVKRGRPYKTSAIVMRKTGYSKVSVVRPGRSRLLEFKKKIVLVI